MSNTFNVGERGARIEITPSARKPIHNTQFPGFNTMSYRSPNLNKSKERPISTHDTEGKDEVDNILSKPLRPTSPIPIRKLPSGSALDEELFDNGDGDEDSDGESEESILSESPLRITSYSKNNSNYEYSSIKNSDRENSGARELSRQYSQERRRQSVPVMESDDSNIRHYVVYIAAIGAIILAVYFFHANTTEKTVVHRIYDKFSFYNDVKSLVQQYKVQGNSMLQIQTGINSIFERQDTGSFIFAYDSSMNNFDPVKFNNFMNNVASAASRFLRNDTKDVQHIVLDSSKIISLRSDNELINQYREIVEKKGVLLVKDVEKVPSNLAMAFHYYCDEYNPLVKKSAILFTLDVAKCHMSDQKPTHDYIEKCLQQKWRDIEKDKIGPLLTRVVNIVIDIMSV